MKRPDVVGLWVLIISTSLAAVDLNFPDCDTVAWFYRVADLGACKNDNQTNHDPENDDKHGTFHGGAPLGWGDMLIL